MDYQKWLPKKRRAKKFPGKLQKNDWSKIQAAPRTRHKTLSALVRLKVVMP
jgi:hypothetical protein